MYEFLFAKQDQANIDEDELKVLRAAASQYAKLTPKQVEREVAEGRWIELDLGNR